MKSIVLLMVLSAVAAKADAQQAAAGSADPPSVYRPLTVKPPAQDALIPPSGPVAVVRTSRCAGCHVQTGTARLNITGSVAGVGQDSSDAGVRFSVVDGFGLQQNRALGATATVPEDHTRQLLKLPADSGVVITSTCPASVDQLAGLQANDIVLQVNDKPVSTPQQLDGLFASPADLKLNVLRQGEQRSLQRKATKSKRKPVYRLGLQLGTIEPVVQRQLKLDSNVKILVTGIQDSSPAAEAGVRRLDIVLKLNGKPVPTAEAIQQAVADSEGKTMTLQLLRDGEQLTVKMAPRQVAAVSSADGVNRVVDALSSANLQDISKTLEFQDLQLFALPQPQDQEISRELKSLQREVEDLAKLIRQLKAFEEAQQK